MLSEFDITKALRDHLSTMANVPAIATEGVSFTPTTGTPFIAEFALGGNQNAPTLRGHDAYIRGVYQVTVNTPKGSGKWQLLQLTDSIMNHFNKSLVLTRNGVKITITSVSRSAIIQGDAWQSVAVSVYYTAL